MRILLSLFFVFLPEILHEALAENAAYAIDFDPDPEYRNSLNPKLSSTIYLFNKKNEAKRQAEAEKQKSFLEKVTGLWQDRRYRRPRAVYYQIGDQGEIDENPNNCVRCDNDNDDEAVAPDDARINWICGAYEEAFKNFVSVCEMIYYNCMNDMDFQKVGELKCPIAKPMGNYMIPHQP